MIFDCDTRLYEKGLVQKRPIVVNAYNVFKNTNYLLPKFCKELGIDLSCIQYNRNPSPRDQWPADPCMQKLDKEILSSSGVNRPADSEVSLREMHTLDELIRQLTE